MTKNIKIFPSKKIVIFIATLALLSSWRLIRPGYYSMQDDMHVFRLQQLTSCFDDGQIPCRHIQDGGFGYGYPLFNFYSPFFYTFSWLFTRLNFSIINSIKTTLVISNLIGIIGMFLLSQKLFKHKYIPLLATTFFTFFPYKATDMYVRGAFSELMAINFLPITLYFYHLYSQTQTKKNLFMATLLSVCLFTSHNLIALLSLPIIIFFIFWPTFKIKLKKIIPLILGLILSSSFLIPALIEKQYTTINTMTQGYFDYKAHFVTIKQLFFDRSWGYGASLWGPVDDMSFQVGIPQWPLAILAVFLYIKSKRKTNPNTVLIFNLTGLCLGSLFMTHNQSTFIWRTIPFLKFFQFPWRFLSINLFSMSLLSSIIIKYIKPSLQKVTTTILIILTIILNINYFNEDIYYPHQTDQDKLTTTEIIRQSGAGIGDYWPNFGQTIPKHFAPTSPQSIQADTKISSYQKTSNKLKTIVNISQDSDTITLPLAYFPGWQLFIDDKQTNIIIEKI